MAQEAEPLKHLNREIKDMEKDPEENLNLDEIHLTPAPADDRAVEAHDSDKPTEISEEELNKDVDLPRVTYDDARRLMTRTDFFEGLDHDNVRTAVRVGNVGRCAALGEGGCRDACR